MANLTRIFSFLWSRPIAASIAGARSRLSTAAVATDSKGNVPKLLLKLPLDISC